MPREPRTWRWRRRRRGRREKKSRIQFVSLYNILSVRCAHLFKFFSLRRCHFSFESFFFFLYFSRFVVLPVPLKLTMSDFLYSFLKYNSFCDRFEWPRTNRSKQIEFLFCTCSMNAGFILYFFWWKISKGSSSLSTYFSFFIYTFLLLFSIALTKWNCIEWNGEQQTENTWKKKSIVLKRRQSNLIVFLFPFECVVSLNLCLFLSFCFIRFFFSRLVVTVAAQSFRFVERDHLFIFFYVHSINSCFFLISAKRWMQHVCLSNKKEWSLCHNKFEKRKRNKNWMPARNREGEIENYHLIA